MHWSVPALSIRVSFILGSFPVENYATTQIPLFLTYHNPVLVKPFPTLRSLTLGKNGFSENVVRMSCGDLVAVKINDLEEEGERFLPFACHELAPQPTHNSAAHASVSFLAQKFDPECEPDATPDMILRVRRHEPKSQRAFCHTARVSFEPSSLAIH
jgi:hypothetical protein